MLTATERQYVIASLHNAVYVPLRAHWRRVQQSVATVESLLHDMCLCKHLQQSFVHKPASPLPCLLAMTAASEYLASWSFVTYLCSRAAGMEGIFAEQTPETATKAGHSGSTSNDSSSTPDHPHLSKVHCLIFSIACN
jgi:hypothetical protein